ncbi:tRNA (adenosine(37)-N6)-threonylcarbamoyltransferase complex dimerization subunit type 1 TsaB [Marinigracilibium pacificum]|uniref:tRNA (Adenosine(37)-N6)-threonylcarbamoyltransferase complex dimerization subunit type 1 TsaB n=1 Tax=Marinigracilibium pacificum TaxID=2729599 RepID=A0A848IY93_9BACT|nr:tRNA (adenosine(37)-N6)-threonylcarbamoyltransferase complex dimerization subunit type 1 TsaB [Marinigracilibium pacificum]NMM47260.1 tRNA (adenosine(37)-N6)-threonylcarbamoyltransferase complex dimerization subunit type 1 TsaB [Marinigracilibium pacificum]
MIILALETATSICSVAVLEDDKVLGKIDLNIERAHSSKLATAIDELLKLLDLAIVDLSAVAVSKGPGSYTGLRIGVSTAKGICYGNNIPLIGVETLEGMAVQANSYIESSADYILFPMIDARRMEVYTSAFSSSIIKLEETHPLIADENTFSDNYTDKEIYLFGDGAKKVYDIIDRNGVYYIPGLQPDAIGIGKVAIEKFKQNDFEDVAYFEPFYLKEYKAGKPKSLLTNG